MMLVIHMDPVERDNKRLAQYRSLISRVLMDIDIRLSFHDFRIVGSGKMCVWCSIWWFQENIKHRQWED